MVMVTYISRWWYGLLCVSEGVFVVFPNYTKLVMSHTLSHTPVKCMASTCVNTDELEQSHWKGESVHRWMLMKVSKILHFHETLMRQIQNRQSSRGSWNFFFSMQIKLRLSHVESSSVEFLLMKFMTSYKWCSCFQLYLWISALALSESSYFVSRSHTDESSGTSSHSSRYSELKVEARNDWKTCTTRRKNKNND